MVKKHPSLAIVPFIRIVFHPGQDDLRAFAQSTLILFEDDAMTTLLFLHF
jgi:hypothetical protein